MSWTIALITFVLWLLGFASGAPLGLWVHLLLAFSLLSLVLAVAPLARRKEPDW